MLHHESELTSIQPSCLKTFATSCSAHLDGNKFAPMLKIRTASGEWVPTPDCDYRLKRPDMFGFFEMILRHLKAAPETLETRAKRARDKAASNLKTLTPRLTFAQPTLTADFIKQLTSSNDL
jgi:hypothetical protein